MFKFGAAIRTLCIIFALGNIVFAAATSANIKIGKNRHLGKLVELTRTSEHTEDWGTWDKGHFDGKIKIRGKSYFPKKKDKDKYNPTSSQQLLDLISVKMLTSAAGGDAEDSKILSLVASETESSAYKRHLVIHWKLQQGSKGFLHMVLCFGQPAGEKSADVPESTHALFEEFMNQDTDDAKRDARLKMVPVISKPRLVSMLVKSNPAILGKLSTSYLHSGNMMMVTINPNTALAKTLIPTCLKWAGSIEADLFFLLEAQTPEELPEYLLGSVNLQKVKLKAVTSLYE